MKIAINGMGRIGRLLFRRLISKTDIEIVAVNDIIEPENLTYLLKYDSIYGPFQTQVIYRESGWEIDGRRIRIFREAVPDHLPWKELQVDVVLECSGRFLDRRSVSMHLAAGAKKVLLSTTGKPDIPLRVYGFSHMDDINDVDILSPGGCMTNCSTHVLDIFERNGMETGMINMLHSYTSRQSLVDTAHNHYRRGRAAAESIIPVDVDLTDSLVRLLPSLAGRVSASSVRVPVANGAYANFFVVMDRQISVDDVKTFFRDSARGRLKGIVDYTEEPLVSLDIKGNRHSCIIDGTEIYVTGRMVRVSAWFDNEYGFTSRMIDWIEAVKGMMG